MKVIGILPIVFITVGAQVNCNGGPLNAAARGDIVAQHNRLRSSVAKGESSPGPAGGQNVFALSYDCTLEAQAQAHANRCVANRSPLNTRPDAGENIYRYTGAAQAPGAISFSAIQWWNQIFKGWPAAADNVYTQAVHNTGIDMYAQMAWGASTRVGCGFAQCAGFKSVVCQYRTGGPQIGQAMVQPGLACSAGGPCNTFPGSTCDAATGLCQAPPGTDPIPPATTTAGSTTTVSTTASPLDLCTISALMDGAARELVVTKLNEVRSLLARGQDIVPGQFKRGSQSVFALKYNCDLETPASVTSEGCPAAAGAVPGVGQTIAHEAAVPADASAMVTAAVTAWLGQVNTYVPGTELPNAPNIVADVGNIAQVLAAPAKTVGCAYATCPGAAAGNPPRAVLVCNFDPQFDQASNPYTPESSTGCRKNKCTAGAPTATCNRTSGLCELP